MDSQERWVVRALVAIVAAMNLGNGCRQPSESCSPQTMPAGPPVWLVTVDAGGGQAFDPGIILEWTGTDPRAREAEKTKGFTRLQIDGKEYLSFYVCENPTLEPFLRVCFRQVSHESGAKTIEVVTTADQGVLLKFGFTTQVVHNESGLLPNPTFVPAGEHRSLVRIEPTNDASTRRH